MVRHTPEAGEVLAGRLVQRGNLVKGATYDFSTEGPSLSLLACVTEQINHKARNLQVVDGGRPQVYPQGNGFATRDEMLAYQPGSDPRALWATLQLELGSSVDTLVGVRLGVRPLDDTVDVPPRTRLTLPQRLALIAFTGEYPNPIDGGTDKMHPNTYHLPYIDCRRSH